MYRCTSLFHIFMYHHMSMWTNWSCWYRVSFTISTSNILAVVYGQILIHPKYPSTHNSVKNNRWHHAIIIFVWSRISDDIFSTTTPYALSTVPLHESLIIHISHFSNIIEMLFLDGGFFAWARSSIFYTILEKNFYNHSINVTIP